MLACRDSVRGASRGVWLPWQITANSPLHGESYLDKNAAPIRGDVIPIHPPALTSATPWQDVVDAYLDAAVDSPETRRSYGRHLDAALTFLQV